MTANRRPTGKKRVTLDCDAEPGRDVFVSGTFNNWDARRKPMKAVEGSGRYRAVLMLPPGQYEYKFVVDDDWRIDVNNPHWIPNGFGSLNSVIDVG